MTKGTVFGIAMALVGGVIALCSAGPRCEDVTTKKAKVTILRCDKIPGHFNYDKNDHPTAYIEDTYRITVLFQGCRYTIETFGPWPVGKTVYAYVDEMSYSDGNKRYRLVSLIGGE